jgi:hypothetical protein
LATVITRFSGGFDLLGHQFRELLTIVGDPIAGDGIEAIVGKNANWVAVPRAPDHAGNVLVTWTGGAEVGTATGFDK